MTLTQLEYLTEIASTGSINKAANRLYISQSTISTAVRELEIEFGISIFQRTNKGVVFTESGRAFYNSIRPIVEQKQKVERMFLKDSKERILTLNISTQHYPFCAQAFTAFMETMQSPIYELRLKETDSYHVIEDVSSGRSELGIIFLSNSTERFIRKVLEAHRLSFHILHVVTPHVFLRGSHPLTKFEEIDANDLSIYPYVIFDQDPALSEHYSEEVALDDFKPSGKKIYINDRGTVYSILANSNAFSIGSGLLPNGFHDQEITAIPLKNPSDQMRLGYIVKNEKNISEPAQKYIDIMSQCIKN